MENLKIAVIRSPYDTFDNKDTQELFQKIVAMKLRGYKRDYDYGVLPVDTSDYFSDHIAVCEEVNGDLEPICVYKSVPLSKCREFNFDFPALSIIKKGGSINCANEIQSIINDCDERNVDLSYDCSWTVKPEYRKTEKALLLRNIAMGLGVLHHGEFSIPEWMTCGILRMKTDKFFESMGLQPIGNEAIFKHSSLCNEEAVMVHLKSFSFQARVMGEKYRPLWNDKLLIDGKKHVKIAA